MDEQKVEAQTVVELDRLKRLYQIDRAILAARSPGEIAQVAVKHIRQLIPCSWIGIVEHARPGEGGQLLGVDVDDQAPDIEMSLLCSASETAFPEGKARLIEDTLQSPDPSPLIRGLCAQGLRSFLQVPLMVGDTLIGCLNLGSDKPVAFAPEDLQMAHEVAALLAIVIQNSRLIEAERRRSAELANTNAFITVLGRVALHLQTNLELEQVVNTLGDELAQLGISCFMALWNEGQESLTLHFASVKSGASPLIARGVSSQLGLDALQELYGDIDQLLDRHQPIFVPKPMPGAIALANVMCVENAERMVRLAGMTSASKAICLPLVIAKRLLGVLGIWGEGLREEDMAAASLFASQVAVAIENARLLKTLKEHRRRLRMLSMRLLDAQEEERKRISEEIHHEMGQALTAIRIDLARLEHEWPAESGSAGLALLRESQATVDQTLERMRELALSLRPSTLDTFGLIPALRWYLDSYAKRLNIATRFDITNLVEEERFPPRIETAIYRIAQEALTNTARHAQASKVTVRLERTADAVIVYIMDDGRGFDELEVARRGLRHAGMGLLTMRERVYALGGSFGLRSRYGDGVQLRIEIPLDPGGLIEP
jgi:signal transduction histidine kinase